MQTGKSRLTSRRTAKGQELAGLPFSSPCVILSLVLAQHRLLLYRIYLETCYSHANYDASMRAFTPRIKARHGFFSSDRRILL